MNNSINITTTTVEIHIAKVDGKKMTKAVFNQIQSYQDKDYNVNIIGYVDFGSKERFLLCITNGQLRKMYFNKNVGMIDIEHFQISEKEKQILLELDKSIPQIFIAI